MKKKRNTANIFDEFIYYGDEWRPPNKRQTESAHTSGHIPLTTTHHHRHCHHSFIYQFMKSNKLTYLLTFS